MINNKIFSIPSFLPKISSYQLSVFDIDKKIAVSRHLSNDNNEENFFLNYYSKYQTQTKTFRKELDQLLLTRKNYNEKKMKATLKKYEYLGEIAFFLSRGETRLEKIFTNDEYIEFYSNFSLYKIIVKIDNNYDIVKDMVKYIDTKINQIKKDDMKSYQRILLIEHISGLAIKCGSKEALENANFSYYLMSKKKDNSVLDFVEKFFKKYSELLTEESPVFEKLLEIDSGSGYYNNELFYCYNMQNLSEIKKHLKKIESSIFVIHDLDNKSYAFTDIESGMVSINIHKIKPVKLGFPLDKTLQNNQIEMGKNIACKFIYYLLHEINGHKKFSYKKNNNSPSPSNFFENGTIYKFANINSKENGENIIKVIQDDSKGEDGYFYELCYGKIGDFYTFQILDSLDDLSELLEEVNLWVNDLKSLREFIKYKFVVQNYGKPVYKSDKLTIKEKINDYHR